MTHPSVPSRSSERMPSEGTGLPAGSLYASLADALEKLSPDARQIVIQRFQELPPHEARAVIEDIERAPPAWRSDVVDRLAKLPSERLSAVLAELRDLPSGQRDSALQRLVGLSGEATAAVQQPADPKPAPVGPADSRVQRDVSAAWQAADLAGTEAGPALGAIVEMAQRAGIDLSRFEFSDLMELLTQAREYTEQVRREDAEQAARVKAADLEGRLSEERVKIESREAWVRFSLALLLIFGAVSGVILAIAIGLDAEAVAQYLAPISGLAGIAVGYFFGRQSQG
jgi:hypothetical protein